MCELETRLQQKIAERQNTPTRLLITKEGFHAVLQWKGDSFLATILNSSIPRCYQLLHVPVVFDRSCTIHDLPERDSQWQRSHVQLLTINGSKILFIGKIGLCGGGPVFSSRPTDPLLLFGEFLNFIPAGSATYLINDLRYSMNEINRNELIPAIERDLRSKSNAMANATVTNKTTQEPPELGEESRKMIDNITKEDHLHDITSLALAAGAVRASIFIYDEKDDLKYIVGSGFPGKPIEIIHFTPSELYPVGHYSPLDPDILEIASGNNSCALDAVVANLSPAQRESLQISNVSDLRDKMVEQIKANPKQAEQMYQIRSQLIEKAPDSIFAGGMPKLKDTKRFNKVKASYGIFSLENDSSTMNLASMDEMQEHHLIHRKLRNHRAIVESGFNIDEPINIIACPKSEKIRKQLGTNRSVHCGRHPEALVEELRAQLDEAYIMYKGNSVELKRAVLEISYSERLLVRSGERYLHNYTAKKLK